MAWMKVLADGMTGLRLLLSVMLATGGLVLGADGVDAAAVLVLVAWTTDALDGPLARKSGRGQTWLGRSDVLIDMFFAISLLLFMVSSALIRPIVFWTYLVVWAAIFWRCGRVTKPLGAAFQGPVYIWFGLRLLAQRLLVGRIMVVWVLADVVMTRRRLALRDVPGFVQGIRHAMGRLLSRASDRGRS